MVAMYSQVDNDRYHHSILESIIDFRKNTKAISKDNMYIMTESGQRRLRKYTVGWDFRVSWSDGSESWVPLSLLNNSYPIEADEFAVAWKIAAEPTLAWWVPSP